MATVTFFEKTGCAGNALQKKLLADSGHEVRARDVRSKTWTNSDLLEFLAGSPISRWFSPSAPAIRSGEILPGELDELAALGLLRGDPLLLRRPLMQVGSERRVGFDAAAIDAWIGLSELPGEEIEGCQRPPQAPAVFYVQTAGGGAMCCEFIAATRHAEGCEHG